MTARVDFSTTRSGDMLGGMARSLVRGGVGVAVPLLAAAVCWGAPALAEAGVQGRRGIEIEGPQDRRGLYVGTGLDFGGTFFSSRDFLPSMRAHFVIGGGVTKRFTLGADLHVMPYLAPRVGVAFGGDIEAHGFLWRGLFLRGALGATGVPRREVEGQTDGLTVGLGGKFGLGYEVFLNMSAAMSVALDYDLRVVPGTSFPYQTALVGFRFVWY